MPRKQLFANESLAEVTGIKKIAAADVSDQSGDEEGAPVPEENRFVFQAVVGDKTSGNLKAKRVVWVSHWEFIRLHGCLKELENYYVGLEQLLGTGPGMETYATQKKTLIEEYRKLVGMAPLPQPEPVRPSVISTSRPARSEAEPTLGKRDPEPRIDQYKPAHPEPTPKPLAKPQIPEETPAERLNRIELTKLNEGFSNRVAARTSDGRIR